MNIDDLFLTGQTDSWLAYETPYQLTEISGGVYNSTYFNDLDGSADEMDDARTWATVTNQARD